MSSNTCLNECPHSHPQQHHQNHTTIIISHSKTIPYYINTHPFSLESSVSLVLCFSLSSLSLTLDYQISGSVPYFSASCVSSASPGLDISHHLLLWACIFWIHLEMDRHRRKLARTKQQQSSYSEGLFLLFPFHISLCKCINFLHAFHSNTYNYMLLSFRGQQYWMGVHKHDRARRRSHP